MASRALEPTLGTCSIDGHLPQMPSPGKAQSVIPYNASDLIRAMEHAHGPMQAETSSLTARFGTAITTLLRRPLRRTHHAAAVANPRP